jgi:hypothetical protein
MCLCAINLYWPSITFIFRRHRRRHLRLNYTRVSGNMNLGLVVLSETNEVFFQASLVTSESLATTFALPEAGQYTIGVFRISLVGQDEVVPTVLQLRGGIMAE